ncbi:MAG TPA: CDP-alcohol phosphatidyltransferase family protein [Stellaceae bacterium]|nr:CDP-alcohol phosphatidyltransferase family protein [Stellaceae bacterium]
MSGTTDRRPIAAREHPLAKAAAGWLLRRGVSANSISIGGLLCGCAAGAAFAATASAGKAAWILWLAGAVLVQARLLANMLDGMVAIGSGSASRLGELFNEIPDRISDSVVLVGIGIAAGNWGLGMAAALAAIATAYVRAVGKASGAGSDYSGPMAKQQRMFLATALAVWMAFAPEGWRPTIGGESLLELYLIVVILGAGITAVRRTLNIARALRRQGGS